jgi:hypothetical protein
MTTSTGGEIVVAKRLQHLYRRPVNGCTLGAASGHSLIALALVDTPVVAKAAAAAVVVLLDRVLCKVGLCLLKIHGITHLTHTTPHAQHVHRTSH